MNYKTFDNNYLSKKTWGTYLHNVDINYAENMVYDNIDAIGWDKCISTDSSFSDKDSAITIELIKYKIDDFNIDIYPSHHESISNEGDSYFFYSYYDNTTNKLIYEDSSSLLVGLSNMLNCVMGCDYADMDYMYNHVKCDVLIAVE